MSERRDTNLDNQDLLLASCRVALAGLLHDLGKFAERANMPVDREILESNKQVYCPHRRPYANSPGWFTHVHAAYTALALDALEPSLPPIKGSDVHPFDEWGAAESGGGDNSLINAAAKHHKPDTFLQWIVATADRAASGLDRETFDAYNESSDDNSQTGKSHYTARQFTLFEQVDIGAAGKVAKRDAPQWAYRYRLAPQTPASIFPVKARGYETNERAVARKEYFDLWEQFRGALDRIPASHRHNLPLWLDHFDTLWQMFTHAIPAATAFNTIPDVSLYDHSRIVAALATSIWRYHHELGDDPSTVRGRLASRSDWDDTKFLFVQGDLFGIQDFIFASGGATEKQAAKLLRGRSLQVTLLAECAALRVLDALSLPATSQIMNAAGKFQIVAPNTSGAVDALEGVRAELDEWFLRHTYGQSGVGIAWTDATCNDLQAGGGEGSPYRALVQRLFEELEEVKLRRFDLCGTSAPNPVFRGYLEAVGQHGVCAVDGRSPADGATSSADANLSRLARDQIEIGNLLVRDDRNRLLISNRALTGPNVNALKTDIFGLHIAFSGVGEAFGKFGDDATSGSFLRVWDFSLPEDLDAPLFNGYARRDLNAWVPRYNEQDLEDGERYEANADNNSRPRELGQLKTFNDIACEARQRSALDNGLLGVSALMTLKGDVDNLGVILGQGLQTPSLSRMAALSRQMNAFFCVYLPYLCRTEFRDTYTVFAGGDDFFLIGPWSEQMDLAMRLREDFSRYVANNDKVGFSVGLNMTKPGLPVRRIEAMAEAALEQSKRYAPNRAGPTKNAITCFDRTVDWPTFSMLLAARKSLARLEKEVGLSRGYVYGLKELVDMREKLATNPENARWHSLFYYRTWRMLERTRGMKPEDRRRHFDQVAKAIVGEGIEQFSGDYRIALFAHLYRNRV